MNTIELYNVTKQRGKNVILDSISFKLEKGKIYGLVGANGSGKSTLINIILGLTSSTGEIFINGYSLKEEYKSALKNVGAIVDYVSFYEFLTAYENLRYFSYIYKTPFERIKEVMNVVKLDIKDTKLVKNYSLGMKQRLGIAVSLLKDPEILILDEPTNGLDPKGIKELRELLLSFKDKTIIISSHLISEIEKIVDEVLFIHNKKIIMKSVKHVNGVHNIKFKVDNYDLASSLIPGLEENKSLKMSDKEVSKNIKSLIDNNVNIYRVEEDNDLESTLLSMMENK